MDRRKFIKNMAAGGMVSLFGQKLIDFPKLTLLPRGNTPSALTDSAAQNIQSLTYDATTKIIFKVTGVEDELVRYYDPEIEGYDGYVHDVCFKGRCLVGGGRHYPCTLAYTKWVPADNEDLEKLLADIKPDSIVLVEGTLNIWFSEAFLSFYEPAYHLLEQQCQNDLQGWFFHRCIP